MSEWTIRPLQNGEEQILYDLIRGLARYEKIENELDTSPELLRTALLKNRYAEAVLGFEDGKPVAYAIFFYSFSTFLAKRGLFLEDLYIIPEKRGKGYGRALLAYLANYARENGCRRMEWNCLDWNLPSIAFYESLGAEARPDWTTFRLHGKALDDLAALKEGLSVGPEHDPQKN